MWQGDSRPRAAKIDLAPLDRYMYSEEKQTYPWFKASPIISSGERLKNSILSALNF